MPRPTIHPLKHLVYALSVVLFVVVSLPHHHHGGSPAACFNPFHTLCADACSPHDAPAPTAHHCTVKVDTPAPVKAGFTALPLPEAGLVVLRTVTPPPGAGLVPQPPARARGRGEPLSLHTRYIARALRLRAPSIVG